MSSGAKIIAFTLTLLTIPHMCDTITVMRVGPTCVFALLLHAASQSVIRIRELLRFEGVYLCFTIHTKQ